jgi:hypothetical protein
MKKKTNNIPNGYILAIMVIFAVTFVLFITLGTRRLEHSDSSSYKLSSSNDDICRDRIFQGEAKIHVWPVQEKGDMVLRIKDSDISQMPLNNEKPIEKISEIKIVDLTPEVENAITSAAEDMPAEVTIKGYLSRCNEGIPLAVLDYKDNVFSNYVGK